MKQQKQQKEYGKKRKIDRERREMEKKTGEIMQND